MAVLCCFTNRDLHSGVPALGPNAVASPTLPGQIATIEFEDQRQKKELMVVPRLVNIVLHVSFQTNGPQQVKIHCNGLPTRNCVCCSEYVLNTYENNQTEAWLEKEENCQHSKWPSNQPSLRQIFLACKL